MNTHMHAQVLCSALNHIGKGRHGRRIKYKPTAKPRTIPHVRTTVFFFFFFFSFFFSFFYVAQVTIKTGQSSIKTPLSCKKIRLELTPDRH